MPLSSASRPMTHSPRGGTANRTSDIYVLGTVLLATIILLASLGPRLRGRNTRRSMVLLSGVALLFAIGWLAARPVAWVG